MAAFIGIHAGFAIDCRYDDQGRIVGGRVMVAAVILAGGLARRMGGGDKGRLLLGDTTLIQMVIARVRPQVDALVLNANGDGARFADLGLPVVADSIPDHPGPLAGILAGMDWAAQAGHTHVLSVPADTPFIPPDLVARLSAANAPIAMAASCTACGVVRQPVVGLWPVSLRDDLRHALGGGVRKIGQWAHPHGVALIQWPDTPNDPFLNINTPDDLERARRIPAR